MTAITAKNFTAALSAIIRSQTSQRAKIQALILFGMAYANESEGHNCLYLTKLVQGLDSAGVTRTLAIQKFIMAHCACIWTKDKTGVAIFKPHKEWAYTEPTCNWWEFDKAGKAVPDYDFEKALKHFITKAEGADLGPVHAAMLDAIKVAANQAVVEQLAANS